jgi:phosphatidylglycerophosphate synthase
MAGNLSLSDRFRARFTLIVVLHALANWWDSVELWVTQLDFPFQVALAIVVLLPLCAGVAVLCDLASDLVDGWIARIRVHKGEGGPGA